VREESDVRIGIAEQRDQPLGHAAGEPAAVLLLELHRIGKPADSVAERADRELDQHLAVGRRVFVREHALALLPGLDAEADVVALGAVDAAALEFGLEQDIAGVEIAEPHPPGVRTLRQHHAAPVVEIEPQPAEAFLRGHIGRRRIGALRRRRGGRRRLARSLARLRRGRRG
jgi:hypothetical protein